jgi:alpha-2-macroglobulin
MQPPAGMSLRRLVSLRLTSSITLAGFAFALSCGGNNPRRDLQVMSFAPAGAIDQPEQIVIRFDRPVVEEAMVTRPVDTAAVTVTPRFAWKGFWRDRQTLVIDPVERLQPSTRYTMALGRSLAAKTPSFEMAFVHRPLVVEGVVGVDPDMIPPDGELRIAFNQPVAPIDVAAHCKLVGAGAEVALIATPTPPATSVPVVPARPLAQGKSYALRCAGLIGAGGNLALEPAYERALTVRPQLEVESLVPLPDDDVPADEVTLTIQFSTPVTLEAARKAITSTPPIAALANGYLDGDGTTYQVTTDLEATTKYTLRIAELTDTFGQSLARPFVGTFTTGAARPRISMERGIYAVEAAAKGYPVWTRNVGKYEVECAAIPKGRIVQVLTTDMNYDPWGGNADDKPIDWKAIAVRPRTAVVTPAARATWQLAELDLGKTCGRADGTRGVYLAEVRSDEIEPDPHRGWLNPRRNRVLANVTDLGILIKTGTASGIVWVTSLATGAPVAGAKVSVYTPAGKLVHAATTAADGIARIPGSAALKLQPAQSAHDIEYEGWDSYRSQRLIAIVEHGADLAVVDGNWANGIQLWNFGVAEDRRGGATKLRGFVQSDRGLYRPGESVHLKGLVREIARGLPPRVPRTKQVAIEIQDSRGQTVLTTKRSLSAFGGFAFDLALGEEAAVGDYYVRAELAGQVFRERFSVEEFRPSSFEVKVVPRSQAPRAGDTLVFELAARHLMGAPVDGAKVEWSVRKRTHRLRFPGFDQFTFSAEPEHWYWYEPEDYGEFLGDGTGETDATGTLVIEARDPATRREGPVDYILSANVTDAADQTIGKSAVVTAHETAFYLGMHANEFVQAVGMPFGINLVALAPDGARVATKAKLTVIRNVHDCTWSDHTRARQQCQTTARRVIEREIAIAKAGSHTERIVPTEPGELTIRVEAQDDRGKPVVVASRVWVIGKGEAFWSGDEGARMTLVASKPKYTVGDVARLVPQANLVKPTALVTIERDGVIEARVERLASAAQGVEVKIDEAWAPNVYASVALVSGRHGVGDRHRPQFKMGLVELAVESAHKQLAVDVALDRANVRPGEPVTGRIRVSHAGKPVKAEVSLSVADEGILQLISYQTPNPMKTFYASYGLGVDAATNWNRIARLADPTKGDPDEGGDSGSGGDGQRIRSRFVASAHWAPMLITDERGEIAFSFPAPDNLTAFRLMAVAADAGDRFGAGEQRLVIAKPLMAVPALPRFLRSGDAASVGVVIHNHSDAAGEAVVTATASGATLVGDTRKAVAVPARGSARVRFAAKAPQGQASATFGFAVALGSERDAVQVMLPIDRPLVRDSRLLVEHRLGKGGTWTGTLGVTGDVLRDDSTLTITIDRSGVGDLAPGLRSLVEYPYGCLEQTMSRFIPLVAAKELAKTLADPSLQGTKARQFIAAGIAKVIRHQQGDGSFSLWPQSQTHPHLAAYALWGLTVAEQSGEAVPAEVFDRGIHALRTWANTSGTLKPDGDGAVMAMAAYVMALRGKPDPSLHARLYNLRAGLPRWGQAFLLRAMKRAKADPRQLAELQQLVEAGIVLGSDGKALVRETPGDDHYHYMHSDIRASAMTLAALLEVDPGNRRIDPLAAGIKAARDSGGNWVSTQETLWSLVALAEYGRRAGSGATTARVSVGGKPLLARRIAGTEIATVEVPLSQLAGDQVELGVDQPAHVSVRVREARADALAPAAKGFEIERSYLDVKDRPVTSVKAGDLVKVKLTVTALGTRQWVALVDPIPAGFEVVNPKLASGASLQPAKNPWARRVGLVQWDHEEVRDDRVQWFADAMRAGTYELVYEARATIDGTFTAMPATIEAMYRPDVRARTASSRIVVTP